MYASCVTTINLMVHETRQTIMPQHIRSLTIFTWTLPMTKTCRRMVICTALASTLLAAVSAPPALAQLREKALGVWVEEDGGAHIEIVSCQDKLCGHIVWLKNPTDQNGQPQTDRNNPNPALRNRPILGMLIMAGLQPNDDNTYLEGRVYNSEDGKVYDVFLTPARDTMKVEGCLMKILCASQTWTRVR